MTEIDELILDLRKISMMHSVSRYKREVCENAAIAIAKLRDENIYFHNIIHNEDIKNIVQNFTPCDMCKYYPPLKSDKKPCFYCPAAKAE